MTWICNHIRTYLGNVIIHRSPQFNGRLVEVREWMSNYILTTIKIKTRCFLKFVLNLINKRLIISNIKLVSVIAQKQQYVITHPCPKFKFNLSH